MEKKLKLRLPRLVRSSFNSCRPRSLYDVVETSTFTSHTTSTFQKLFPSVSKPTDTPRRPRCREVNSSLFYTPVKRHTFCPPASPVFPANPYYGESRSFRALDKDSKKTKTKRPICQRNRKRSQVGSDYLFNSSSLDGSCRFKSTGSWCWSSSDDDNEEQKKELDDDDTDTLFSSRSFSSDSSAVFGQKNPNHCQKMPSSRREDETVAEGGVPPENEKVRDSFAVVKKSSDPYEDFRTSMVEMIVERQIFAAADLQQLLQCFLLLNSRHHHGVILEVFLEIYETLFST